MQLRLEATATEMNNKMNVKTRLSFQPFDEQGQVRIYYNGFLPHWRQRGCTYFVTFRTADSIPTAVYDQWKYERVKWLAARGLDLNDANWKTAFRALAKTDRDSFARAFARKLFKELDKCAGDCVLCQPELVMIVRAAIQYFDGERVDIGDFVIIENQSD